MDLLAPRIGFVLGEDDPYREIERGEINTPIYLIWNQRDGANCANLHYDNLHKAIMEKNPGGNSRVNIDGRILCITDPETRPDPSKPGPVCNLHVPTAKDYAELWTSDDNTTCKELVDDVYNWALSLL